MREYYERPGGDALALPFGDGAFERVAAGHFYGHLEPPDRELSWPRPGAWLRSC